MTPKKILFVCLGNICRSPAAQGVMQALVDEAGLTDSFVLDSAGTGRYHIGELPDRRMRLAARRRGIELTHHCRQVEQDDFSRFDLIIAMDESNFTRLRELSPSVEGDSRIHRMSEWFSARNRQFHHFVPDPYYEGAEGFELVLDLLQDACQNLLNELRNNEES